MSEELTIFGERILEMRYASDQCNNVYKNINYLDNLGRIIIEANHPARESNFTEKLANNDALFILELQKLYKGIHKNQKCHEDYIKNKAAQKKSFIGELRKFLKYF